MPSLAWYFLQFTGMLVHLMELAAWGGKEARPSDLLQTGAPSQCSGSLPRTFSFQLRILICMLEAKPPPPPKTAAGELLSPSASAHTGTHVIYASWNCFPIVLCAHSLLGYRLLHPSPGCLLFHVSSHCNFSTALDEV